MLLNYPSEKELAVLRRLAAKKVEYAACAENTERRNAWYDLDDGKNNRPMILTEHGGISEEILPESVLECEGELARNLEMNLRHELYSFEELKDDRVLEPYMKLKWRVECSNYGVEARRNNVENDGKMAAHSWDPPLKNLDEDLNKLKPRTFEVDREATYKLREMYENIFKGVMDIQIRGKFWWSMGLTIEAIQLIGMENMMFCMFDNSQGLHRLMQFLCDENLRFARWLESENLFTPDNKNDYTGSGSLGYSRKLISDDRKAGEKVLMSELWNLLESQETVGVGPDQFEEFIFPYHKIIAENFGRIYYGCCEPLHSRLDIIKRLPNLARVAVSPWADEEKMAEGIKRDFVYSRKPNPTLISTERFDETAIREDLRKTLNAARDCRLEIIMKDVHTVNNEPQRLSRWVEIAREETER